VRPLRPLIRWLLPDGAPVYVSLAAATYFAHILCEGWISSSQGFLGLAVIFTAIAWKRGEIEPAGHPLLLPLALFVAGSYLSAFFAPEPLRTAGRVHDWLNFLTFFVALTLYHRYPVLVRRAITTFAALAIFLATYGLFQYFILGHRVLETRITGPTAHVMTFSGIILALSLFFLILAFDERKPLWWIAGSLTSLALVLTFTRGAWIGFLAGAITFLALRRARWVAYSVPVLIFLVIISPLAVFGRLVSTFDTQQSSNLDRIRMVEAGIEMIRDRPMVGVGPANVKQVYPLYRSDDAPRFRVPHLHNNIVQIWAERGLVALLGYLFLVGYLIVYCLGRRGAGGSIRTFADAGVAIAVALFVAGLFEYNFGDSEVTMTKLDLFAIILFILGGSAGLGGRHTLSSVPLPGR
jgi:O-antigen ligase